MPIIYSVLALHYFNIQTKVTTKNDRTTIHHEWPGKTNAQRSIQWRAMPYIGMSSIANKMKLYAVGNHFNTGRIAGCGIFIATALHPPSGSDVSYADQA